MTIKLTLNTPEDGDRFNQLTSLIPGGTFYASSGLVIPFRSAPTPFTLETSFSNTRFLVLVNGAQTTFITTDGSGNASFGIQLPLGDCTIEIQREFSTDNVLAYCTTRIYGDWLAAIGDQLKVIDDYTEDTLDAFYLAKAKSTDIDLAHGVPLNTANESGAELEAYRNMLQMIHQALRQYVGMEAGKFEAIAAITGVDPLIFYRYKDGKRWILGYDYLYGYGRRIVDCTRIPSGTLPNINVNGQFITLKSADNFTLPGTGSLYYYQKFKRLKWQPPAGTAWPLLMEMEPLLADGTYSLQTARTMAVLESLHFPKNWVAGTYDHLHLNIDGIGVVDINFDLTTGIAYDVVINSFFSANTAYHYKRVVEVQPAGQLAGLLEIYNISDGDYTNNTGSIIVDASGNVGYKDPLNIVPGTFVSVTPGSTARLVSATSKYWVDVLINYGGLGINKSDTFIAKQRYFRAANFGVATLVANDQVKLWSNTEWPIQGLSNIKVMDGPCNFASILYGFPRNKATLSAVVSSGQTSIQVPNGTWNQFHDTQIPFDVMVGYGPKALVAGTYAITVAVANADQATITTSVPFFAVGDTHVNVYGLTLGQTQLMGAHEIVQIISNTVAIVKYKGCGASDFVGGSLNGAVIVVGIDPKSLYGIGTIEHQLIAGFDYLRFKGVGEAVYGASQLVNGLGDSFYRLFANSGVYVDVISRGPSLPAVPLTVDTFNIGKFYNRAGINLNNLVKWSMGEKVTVTSVTPGAPEIFNLNRQITGNYETTQSVYLINDKWPYITEGVDTFGNLDVEADISLVPAADKNDSVTINGSTLPDGWQYTGSGSPTYGISNDAMLAESSLYNDTNSIDASFVIDIPLKDSMLGYQHEIDVWVRNLALSEFNTQEFKIGSNFGFGWTETTYTLTVPDSNRFKPMFMYHRPIVPHNATQFQVRIRRTTNATPNKFIIDYVLVRKRYFDGLFLGDGTIPRSPGRETYSELMCVWSPDVLTNTEMQLIGLNDTIRRAGTPADGKILDTSNAMELTDAFDVSEISGPNVLNVLGAIKGGWSGASLVNMQLITRSPTRFNHVVPTLPNMIYGEILTFTGSPPYQANLAHTSDSDQTVMILYENGVPVPQDQWQVNSSTQIQVNTGFNTSAVYTLDYQLLIMATSPVIDLVGAGSSSTYWFADVVVWNRHTSDITTYRENISIIFGADFTATLSQRSDQNKLLSVLTEDTGITKRTIPTINWDYIDSNNIRINGSEFNANAIYTFEYNARILDLFRAATITREIRSGATNPPVTAYTAFDINDMIDSTLRYHQIRVKITNIKDVRDVRIHSMVLKGLVFPSPGF